MRARGRPRHPELLTPRQQEVLSLLRHGLTNEEIAQRLGITLDGVKYHVSDIMRRLEVDSRYEAARWEPTGERRRWWRALAPAGLFAKAPARIGAQVAGAVVVAAAAIGIGLLGYGLIRSYTNETSDEVSAEELVYVRSDQSVWIYDAITGNQRQLLDSGQCSSWTSAEWSRDGDTLAMVCQPSVDAPAYTVLLALDGTEIGRLDGAGSFSPSTAHFALVRTSADDHDDLVIYAVDDDMQGPLVELVDARGGSFSPDGSSLAFYRDSGAPCSPTCETGLVIVNLRDGNARTYEDFAPTAWVLDGDAMIVQSPEVVSGEDGYETFLLDIASGRRTPLPALNGYTSFWVAPDGASVVFTARQETLGLAVLDLNTQEVAHIDGSHISFPSDHIPPNHVALSDELIYWFDATGDGSPWFSARYDGGGLTRLADAPTHFLQFSPSRTFVAFHTSAPPGESRVVVRRIDGTLAVDVAPSGFTMNWRPRGD